MKQAALVAGVIVTATAIVLGFVSRCSSSASPSAEQTGEPRGNASDPSQSRKTDSSRRAIAVFTSPNGKFKLQAFAQSALPPRTFEYVLHREEALQWQTAAYGLLERAVVSDAGAVFGYGYESGYQGDVLRWTGPSRSDILVYCGDADAPIESIGTIARGGPQVNFNRALPALPVVDALAVSADESELELWCKTDVDGIVKVYRYSRVERALSAVSAELRPPKNTIGRLVSVTPIPDLHSYVCEWVLFRGAPDSLGAALTIVDRNWQVLAATEISAGYRAGEVRGFGEANSHRLRVQDRMVEFDAPEAKLRFRIQASAGNTLQLVPDVHP